MKRVTWLAASCLLGGLMVVTVVSSLCGPARAVDVADPVANALDVVINEVAWMGTTADSSDEWIELYNNTDQDIDLTGWSITAADGTPNISLSGVISAHEYFLLERTNDDPVSDIPADQTYTGGMGNSGEVLTLTNGIGVIDTANGDDGGWPEGNNSTKHTMERIDPTALDTDDNWCTNDGITRNGLDASSNPITGTPKAENSCYHLSVANLVVSKSGPATVEAGDFITYHVTLGNTGNTTATGTLLTDTLPISTTYVSDDSGWMCPACIPGATAIITWDVGDVPSNTLHAFNLTARVDISVTDSTMLANEVETSTDAAGDDLLDNTDYWETTVASEPVGGATYPNALTYLVALVALAALSCSILAGSAAVLGKREG
jgi:uncharacterized repeat protein (TIGR01451 family)